MMHVAHHFTYLLDCHAVLWHRLVAALPQEVPVHSALVAGTGGQATDGIRHARISSEQDAALQLKSQSVTV
jgi:hypothetical protein